MARSALDDPFDKPIETYGGLLPNTVRESDLYFANPNAPYEYIEPPAAGELPPHLRYPDEARSTYQGGNAPAPAVWDSFDKPDITYPREPWDRPTWTPEGWRSGTNDPVSDEPSGAKYPSDYLGPAERGFIKASSVSPGDRNVNTDESTGPSRDQVVYPRGLPTDRLGYYGLTTLLDQNEIYGQPKPPPAGDVVLPSERTSFYDVTPRVKEEPGRRRNQFSIDPASGPPSALEPVVTQASYAGDVLSPYARGNARLGQPSSVEGVRDDMARKFNTMVEAMPPEVRARVKIDSGFRSPERNAEVYRQYGQPPSKDSRHSHGIALDLGNDPVVLDWIGQNPQFGLGFPLRHMGPKEYNHLEMIENGVRAPLSGKAPQPTQPTQPPSAAAADRTQEVVTDQPSQLHPVFAYENTLEQFPVLHSQQLIAGPGKQLEYWPPNEPGTPERPRPDYIPIDQAGMELGPNSTPMDILGDIVSHHMVKKDPVIKKHFASFKESLTDDQKEQLQAQYNYAAKNQNETRPYAAWEKATGLPAYFRGYAFGQWPAEFNQKAYTPAQRYHFDRMMDYLRGNTHKEPPSALQ